MPSPENDGAPASGLQTLPTGEQHHPILQEPDKRTNALQTLQCFSAALESAFLVFRVRIRGIAALLVKAKRGVSKRLSRL